jgi:hypothetical protein
MMSDLNIIDYVAMDKLSDKLVLIIKEDRPWDDAQTMHNQLKAKIDTYYQYIMDPSFTREYPGKRPSDVVITLFCLQPPGPQNLQFFQYVRQVLAQDKIDFNFLQKPPEGTENGTERLC